MQNNLDMKIAVFCSANDSIASAYFKAAEELGKWMADSGHTLVYGGQNRGLMRCVGEAVHNGGGQIIGVIPQILANSGQRPDCLDVEIPCDNLSDRKDLMIQRSDLIVALPGGVGTLDEVFTVLAAASIGYHDKRVVLFNVGGFWDSLLAMLGDMKGRGVIRPGFDDTLMVVKSVDELVGIVKRM